MELNAWALAGIALVAVVTFYLGQRSSRSASTTHDFLVARRTVRSRRNAAAISGECLSGASFLGVAGVILKDGADALWYPIGFTAGYLTLMLFVAAPLRRSGAYTLPDFLDARLDSAPLRRFSTLLVMFIGLLYMVPQLQGAAIALATIMPAPSWLGAALVTLIVAVNVISGGMRGITVVQAFQYWFKLCAIAVPTFILCAVFIGGGAPDTSESLGEKAPPTFSEETTVDIKADVTLQVSTPTTLWARGEVDGGSTTDYVDWFPGVEHDASEGTSLRFPAGAAVPIVSGSPVDNAGWLRPESGSTGDLLGTYSLIVATFLGTMGLPHALVRFYTNPDGKAARRTTAHILLLLGLFYLFPIILGALSRMYVPDLLVTGKTDAAVLLLPNAILPGVWGKIVAAMTAAGAFAAFLATSSGLLTSVAGALSTDLLRGRVRDFRVVTGVVALVPLLITVFIPGNDLSLSVGILFAMAASTFGPLLLLGVWWRRLTWIGAIAGMTVGGYLVFAALVINLVSGHTGQWAPWFVQQPALITVPVAYLTVIVVSLATKSSVPEDVNGVMLRMHAPDRLGFIKDRAIARFGEAEERVRMSKGRHRR